MDWSTYEHLAFSYPSDGVLLVKFNRPDRLNAMNPRMHNEVSRVWLDADRDPDCRAVVITGEGKAFSAGGDFDMVEATLGDYDVITHLLKEAAAIVHNITDISKPVISAINGQAVGAGLAVALVADISIINEDTRFTDGHHRIGVAAGDHAAFIWPLLCGMAKARYYLLTNDFIDGREAERIGLVSKAVPAADVLPTALRIAEGLAAGPRDAIAVTKRTLNHWLRAATPTFENALALEMMQFFSPDAREGYNAMRDKRAPKFPSNLDVR
jgi:enoyl-CoA hydratase